MVWSTAADAMGAAPQGDGGAMGALGGLAPLILMFVIFYFLLIRPQQKRTKEHKLMLSQLKRGDKVITAGGIFGRIVDLDDNTVSLDLGNSVVTVGRGYISSLASPKAPAEQPKGKKGEADNADKK